MAYTQLFSQRFGYALHTLSYMAKKPLGEFTTAPELAKWMRKFWPTASETYLINVIQRLVRGGLLVSHRGKLGGYSLARTAEEMSLGDVMCALEGIRVTQCNLAPGGECPVRLGCEISQRLRNLEDEYLDSLRGVSIAELACGLGAGVPHHDAEELLPIA